MKEEIIIEKLGIDAMKSIVGGATSLEARTTDTLQADADPNSTSGGGE
jgi:hypothetical protein